MSWIFGIYGKFSQELLEKVKAVHPKTQHVYSENNFYIACAGPEGTYFFKNEINKSSGLSEGMAVRGTGFIKTNSGLKILNENEWFDMLVNQDNANKIDGHYCGAVWKNGNVKLFSDITGVYDIYFCKENEIVLFSTELFQLNSISGSNELDLEVFASGWNTINQLSDRCIIKGIERLTKGAQLNLNESKKIISPAGQSQEAVNQPPLVKMLDQLINSFYESGYSVSLSLSGGIDSRLLLALFAAHNFKNFTVHSFGNPGHPDSVIASQISKGLSLNHTQFNSPLPAIDGCIKLISDYIKDTFCINPCSTIFQLRYYPALYEKKLIIIDGGFAEIGRRYYMNRLLFKNKSAILKKNAESVFRNIALTRADIFNESFTKKMREYSINDVNKLFNELPDARQTGAENWAELFSIRTRLPNFYGIEQKRIGKYVINLMPFGIKNILDSVLRMNLKQRKDGREYKRIISDKCFELTKYKLVKNDSYYWFNSGAIISKIFMKTGLLNSRNQMTSQDYSYLHIVREFVLDLLNSENTRTCEFYDHKKISGNVQKFYAGQKEFGLYLDWWLSFEILRRSVYGIKL